ncbi:MAG: 4-(cytidine 5'-diphospho)-2-C-methyl-D-erythritol kinase [Candidatus Omnitrophota bacterium]
MQAIKLYAPAKLNLYLDVLEKRLDGFHNIKTLFEKIDLLDEIFIRVKGNSIKVNVIPPTCPGGKDNIVYKAASILLKEAGVDIGLEIDIKKNIPVSAGLGGGSSDAATALRSINKILKLGIPEDRLFSIAGSLGKDVPFFMMDYPFAMGSGTGEILEPLDIGHTLSHVIIKPDISISTAEAYERFDDSEKAVDRKDIDKLADALKKKDISLVNENYFNSFEGSLGVYREKVCEIKSLFLNVAHTPGHLSGSGPSVFCTVTQREKALGISKRLSNETTLDVLVATTYKGGIYGDNRDQDIS